jgi:hypothetical protein
VYVIGHELGFEKIGCGDSAEDRRSSLQTGSPYWLSVKTTVDVVGSHQRVEGILHEVYDDYHVRGEWFDLPHEAVAALAQIDTLYGSVISVVDGWTPEKHLDFTEARLRELRVEGVDAEAMDDISEFCELIKSGDFPLENLAADNRAVKNRARSVGIDPALYVEKVEDRL